MSSTRRPAKEGKTRPVSQKLTETPVQTAALIARWLGKESPPSAFAVGWCRVSTTTYARLRVTRDRPNRV